MFDIRAPSMSCMSCTFCPVLLIPVVLKECSVAYIPHICVLHVTLQNKVLTYVKMKEFYMKRADTTTTTTTTAITTSLQPFYGSLDFVNYGGLLQWLFLFLSL